MSFGGPSRVSLTSSHSRAPTLSEIEQQELQDKLNKQLLKNALAEARNPRQAASGGSSSQDSGRGSAPASVDAERDKERAFQLELARRNQENQRDLSDQRSRQEMEAAAQRSADLIAQRREASQRSQSVMRALSGARR